MRGRARWERRIISISCAPARLSSAERWSRRRLIPKRLLSLNEVFIGHRSHFSACCSIAIGGAAEDESLSGLIVASGIGATDWANSIMEAAGTQLPLAPEERVIAHFVREPSACVAAGSWVRADKRV